MNRNKLHFDGNRHIIFGITICKLQGRDFVAVRYYFTRTECLINKQIYQVLKKIDL